MQTDEATTEIDDIGPVIGALPSETQPHRFRLLWVGEQEPSWVGLALKLDADGCQEPQFRWASNPGEALAALRDENFDCVIISDAVARVGSLSPVKPVSLAQAIRGSGYDDPVLLVTAEVDDERAAQLCELECDVLVTSNLYNSPALLPVIRRAMARVEIARENHRLSIVSHRKHVQERDEAEHLLDQQRRIILELDGSARSGVTASTGVTGDEHTVSGPGGQDRIAASGSSPRIDLPSETKEFYHQLLRAYVIMGSGNLGTEIARLAELMVLAGISPLDALGFHLERVETLVRGLGNRSARHVMGRADLLALELMIHIGEGYRKGPDQTREISLSSQNIDESG